MKSTPLDTDTDYLFRKLYDQYVNKVADQCNLPIIADREGIISKVDLSALSAGDQRGFEEWLNKSFYLRISIANALRRGLTVQARLAENTISTKAAYALHIGS